MEAEIQAINISSPGMSAPELEALLSHDKSQVPDGTEFRIPRATPGGLAMIDPGTVQVLLALVSGTGALALALKGLFKVINTVMETRGAPIKMKIGANTLDLPANLPATERVRMYDEFIAKVSAGRK